MEKVELQELAAFFSLYSDETRLKILSCLFKQTYCVQELAELCEMSQSSISHQLAKLRNAKVVKSIKQGKKVYYELDDHHIEQIFENGLNHIREEN